MEKCRFIDENGSFELKGAENYSGLYFPIAGEYGMKSAVTPNLGGDSKLDQNHFLLEPVSVENLHNNRSGRNFWCIVKGKGAWSIAGQSAEQNAMMFTEEQEECTVQAGYMWHKTQRASKRYGLEAEVVSFVPIQKNMEIEQVQIRNSGEQPVTLVPVAAIPIYGRSADNIRDHRHVTSLLHRITVTESGVVVNPTLSFDERGHQINDTIYFVCGMTESGDAPESFFPVADTFIGEGGSFDRPEAVIRNKQGVTAGTKVNGREALGGLRFAEITLQPGESVEYSVFLGTCHKECEIAKMCSEYTSKDNVHWELERVKQYWKNKVNVHYHTADSDFDQFMNWVSFQPELRRIFGCSFLPHHDYGKGGRGWRDLWQDCLALLLMNPGGVRQMLISNFAGVRIDGSNATIIGEHLGEFKADRNSITRVWMDHGVWPLFTTKLYIDQTGDRGILKQEVPYFKDRQVMRGTDTDELWNPEISRQQDARKREYCGTIFEHLLIQNLTSFWEVGEHNHIRLRDADWNDAIDMAGARGESVAFTNAYAKNLLDLADLIDAQDEEYDLLQETMILLQGDEAVYEDIEAKHKVLNEYMEKCRHTVSGIRIQIDGKTLAENLRSKGTWMIDHIRRTEWVKETGGNGWFNGYYDNHGQRVEGDFDGKIRMMLTGQVFAIMAGTATEEQVEAITKSADAYLFDKDCGGYRLNTNFEEIKTDMGRMFGFAYGEKENGAVFSHMAVMYANALYQRGFVAEGYKALESLYLQSMNFEKSRIYPGIPEYFGQGGRGLYHYLTGAASWYMLTVINQMFGVRGESGALVVEPKLLKKQFDSDNRAELSLKFAGRTFFVDFSNPGGKEYKEYQIVSAKLDDKEIAVTNGNKISVADTLIRSLDERTQHRISLVLE